MLATEREKLIIKNTIKNNVRSLKCSDIYIFGCTMYARDIRDCLIDCGLSFCGIIDNNISKVGKECLGFIVKSPDKVLIPYDENAAVIICSKYSHEMKGQLMAMGYTDSSFIIVNLYDENNNLNETETALASVEKGYYAYQHIMKGRSEDCIMFLFPYPGTGDIYMGCTYLPVYVTENDINNYILVVADNKSKRVCGLFGEKDVQIVSKSDMDAILKAWEFLGSKLMNVKPLLHWGWRCKRYLYSDKYPQITFNEMFVYDTFEFSKEPMRTLPQKANNDDVKGFFEENMLIPGKTVILAPYAGSFISEIPDAFWEKIAADLTDKGYKVCTNSSGFNEPVIKGTKTVFFPYEIAIDIVNMAGAFIGLRSGLCDIISSSNAQIIILYEYGFNATNMDFFGLKKMGLNTEAIELYYHTGLETNVITDRFKSNIY